MAVNLGRFISKDSPDVFYKSVKSRCLKERTSSGEVFLSIVIPTYKRAKFLCEAIDSALNQKPADINYEVIVVSNDPEFSLRDLCRVGRGYEHVANLSFYANEQNIGMMGNWNRCLMLAQGKYVAYLHDDDLLNDNYLQEITKILTDKKYSDAGAFCTWPRVFYPGSPKPARRAKIQRLRTAVRKAVTSFRYLYRKPVETLTPMMSLMLLRNIYFTATCGGVVNKEVFMNDGGWRDEGYPQADWITCLRFNEKHKVYFVRQSFGTYRLINEISTTTLLLSDVEAWIASELDVLCRKWEDERTNRFLARHRNMLAYIATESLPFEKAAELCSVFGINLTKPSWISEFLFRRYRGLYAMVHNIDW